MKDCNQKDVEYNLTIQSKKINKKIVLNANLELKELQPNEKVKMDILITKKNALGSKTNEIIDIKLKNTTNTEIKKEKKL